VNATDGSAGIDAPLPLWRPVRVQTIFHVSSDEQAQEVASRMVDRAHEIANLPECECDVDVSIERMPHAKGSADPGCAPAPEPGRPSKS
jgi:hypothetical protein